MVWQNQKLRMLWLYRDSGEAVSGWCKWIRVACTIPASFSSCIFDWPTCTVLRPSQLLPLSPHGCCHCHHLQCPRAHIPLTHMASSSQHFFPSPQLLSPIGWALPPQTSSSQNNCISDHAQSKTALLLFYTWTEAPQLCMFWFRHSPLKRVVSGRILHIPIFQFVHVGGFRPHVRSHASVLRKSLIFGSEIKKLCLVATKSRDRKRTFSIHNQAWFLVTS